MAKKSEETRRIFITPEEAAHIYFMVDMVKAAVLAPPPEVVQIGKKLQERVLKLYPEIKEHLEK